MSDLLSSLTNLKSKLDLLESKVYIDEAREKNEAEKKEKYKSNLSNKLYFIQSTQEQSIELDIRGEQAFISRDSIQDCLFKNELKEILDSGSYETPIYLDYDRNIFKEILNITRFFNKELLGNEDDKNNKVKVNENLPKYKMFPFNEESTKFIELELLSFFKEKLILDYIEFVY